MSFRIKAVVFCAVVFGTGVFAARGAGPTLASSRYTVFMGSALDTTFVGSTTPGLTSIFVASEHALIQLYLGISQTNPMFLAGGGANLKYAVAGDAYNGFHVGFGVGLGAMATASGAPSARSFFVNLSPLLGVHFQVTDRVLLNFDSGATFQVLSEGSSLNFMLGGNSSLLGASVTVGL